MIVDAIADNHNFNFSDYSLMSNYVSQATNDINQTYNRLIRDKNPNESEANPVVAPIIDKAPNAYKPLGFIAEAFLLDRWVKEKNAEKRRNEMFLANLIEAGALAYSKQPWQLQYGFNF